MLNSNLEFWMIIISIALQVAGKIAMCSMPLCLIHHVPIIHKNLTYFLFKYIILTLT